MSRKTNEQISSFEKVTLRIDGMRGSHVYELVADGDKAHLNLYVVRYVQGKREDVLELDCSKDVVTVEALSKLDEVNILVWDGFSGNHPKGVLDGDMFRFDAVVNGRKIKADGSANFPNGYLDFVRWMGEVLRTR